MNLFNKTKKVIQRLYYSHFGNKMHIIDTGLEPGSWYDVDTRMVNGLIQLCIWFVENDMQIWSDEDRSKEIENMKNSEIYNSEFRQMVIDQFNRQMECQDEILAIYKWCKSYKMMEQEIDNIYHEMGDLSYCPINLDNKKIDEKDKAMYEKLSAKVNELEEKLIKDEDEYLTRMIKVRGAMWS